MRFEIIKEILEGPLVSINLLDIPLTQRIGFASFFIANTARQIDIPRLKDSLIQIVVKSPSADRYLIRMYSEDMREWLPLQDQRRDQVVELLKFFQRHVDALSGVRQLSLVLPVRMTRLIYTFWKRTILLQVFAGIADIGRPIWPITLPGCVLLTEFSDILPSAVSASIAAMVSRVTMDCGITATQLTFLIQSAEVTNPIAMLVAGDNLRVTKDLFGNGRWIFLQHPSNLFKTAPLQEFLLDIKPIGECKVFSWLSYSLSHGRSFPADR